MAWIDIPSNFRDTLIAVLEWYLEGHPKRSLPEGEDFCRLNRLLDELYQKRYSLNESTAYFLNIALDEASQDDNSGGIAKNDLSAIQTWLGNNTKKSHL